MDTGFRTPFVEIFRRENVEFDVRLQAAMGMFAPRPAEELALLVHLTADGDGTIASAAEASLARIPVPAIAALLARSDTPIDITAFFAARGITPGAPAMENDGELPGESSTESVPVLDTSHTTTEPDRKTDDDPSVNALQRIGAMSVPQKLSLAMKGTREERSILIRDTNKIVSLGVLSSPKLTESEVEAFARMTSVIEDIPRTIASVRAWSKNYAVCLALVKNPKTPVPVAMNLLPRLNEKDLRGLVSDRNIAELLRTTARRKLAKEQR